MAVRQPGLRPLNKTGYVMALPLRGGRAFFGARPPQTPAPFSSSMTLRGTIALPLHRTSDRSNILPPNNSIRAPQSPGPGRSADADFYNWG